MDFRGAPGHRIDWLDTRIQAGFSNFLFVDREYRSHPVLRRICSLARKHNYQSLLLEELKEEECSSLANENAALAKRRSDYRGSTVHRLSYWRCLPDQVSGVGDFIGYAVFKSDRFSGQDHQQDHIYEAVMPSVRGKDQNNFIHCSRRYSVNTAAGKQTVSGVLYAQQNDLTFVCAHVALRSALASFLPDGDVAYARMNDIVGIDHQNKLVGGDAGGLSPEDMEKILSSLGGSYQKIVHEPSRGFDLPTEFQRDLYGIVESGFPALMGFELDEPAPSPEASRRHIVPVIGHTFNEDAWVPEAQRAYFGNRLGYFSSESWLSAYVLHDDNFGPYYCLPRHFLKKDNFRLILGLQPPQVAVSATDAEAVAFDFFRAIARSNRRIGQDWYDRFAVFSRQNLLVLRALLVTRQAYLRHLREMRSWEDVSVETASIKRLELTLPERFWMVEASAQELFSASRRKFGEVLISSAEPLPRPLNIKPLLAMRLPSLFLIPEAGGLTPVETGLQSHTPLFTLTQSEPESQS